MMEILSVTFTNPENTQVMVETDEGTKSAPWPIQSWHREPVQEWLDEGGVIDPYVEPSPTVEQLRTEEFEALPERIDMLDKLRNATPQQISDYVDSNVTTVAGARMLFKRILVILATQIKS